jgi:hypothetical protein
VPGAPQVGQLARVVLLRRCQLDEGRHRMLLLLGVLHGVLLRRTV